MARISVPPTRLDKDVARVIARRTDPPIEGGAEALTWGADEHVLIVAAAIGWLLTRKSEEPVSRLSTHVLVCSLATAILPHVLKAFVEQERPRPSHDQRPLAWHSILREIVGRVSFRSRPACRRSRIRRDAIAI